MATVTALGRVCVFPAILLMAALLTPQAFAQNDAASGSSETITSILLTKGLLTPEEAKRIDAAAISQQTSDSLARVLLAKGILSQSEYRQILAALPTKSQPPIPHKTSEPIVLSAAYTSAPSSIHRGPQQSPNPTEPGAPSVVEKLPVRTVISALAPIRALPVGALKTKGLTPALVADGVGLTPYGFLKATAIEDSSSPNGDDFPLPGFLSDSGPDGTPEFHIKARGSRVGANFTWNDVDPKWTITGKIEMDFEGNFNRSDNRNISSVRSSNPSLRLAWGRLDYQASNVSTFSALFGQDWTPFGSSTLPNLLETTGLGIGFGSLYERTPQMRIGYTRKAGGIQIMPEFAVLLPAVGLSPSAADISQQLGYGERQGADSNHPDLESRIVAQWQLDHAAGVPPAQIIFSGEYGKRTAEVPAVSIPSKYQAAFSAGASGSSHTDGWDAEWQFPTRYATSVGKFYSGSDLRYFFAGQLYSYFNDVNGLTDVVTVSSVDGSSSIALGTNSDGNQVVAAERPIRTEGGFAQLGFPLSRLFNARPGGRNAGWSFYLLYGVDQAKTRDLDRLGASGNRRYSTMGIGTLNYNMNRWVSFSAEQSLYTTHANPEQILPHFRGVPAREWNDVRLEFGPIFNF